MSDGIDELLKAAAYIEQRGSSLPGVSTDNILESVYCGRNDDTINVNSVTRAVPPTNNATNYVNTTHVHLSHNTSLSSQRQRSSESRNRANKKRHDQDDLFCEEKLIIDEEEPMEAYDNQKSEEQIGKTNNNNGVSPSYGNDYLTKSSITTVKSNVNIENSANLVNTPSIQSYREQMENIVINTSQQNQHNLVIDNSNSNHSQSSGSAHIDVGGSETRRSRSNTSTPVAKSTGTREVHNKLEKNRRAHLKECFDQLKKHIPNMNDKKTSNLAVLGSAITFIKHLRKHQHELDHEVTNMSTKKIELVNTFNMLKKELSTYPQFKNIDFDKLNPDDTTSFPRRKRARRNDALDGLPRGGTRHSSTSGLSSPAPPSSAHLVVQSSALNNVPATTSLPANCTTSVISQTQGLTVTSSNSNTQLAKSNKTSLPNLTGSDDKVTITTIAITSSTSTVSQQPQLQSQHIQLATPAQQQLISHQPAPTTLHLPINTQMINAGPALATYSIPQYRVIQEPQLIALQTNGTVASPANRDTRSVALVVHSTGTDGRHLTMYSNEPRNIVLATTTHAPGVNAQARIKAIEDTQINQKMIGGVTLVGGTGAELTRLPGGAELNLIQPNGVFRSVKTPITVPAGLTLNHAGGVSIQAPKSATASQTTTLVQHATTNNNGSVAPVSAGQQAAQQHHEGIPANCHLVATQSGHQQLTSLAVAPMTVVSQGGSGQVFLAPASSITGKMISAPILKPVAQGHLPIVNAQYINSLVKPVVVVSSNHQQAPQPAPQASNQQSVATSNGTSKNGTSSGSQSVV